MGFIGLHPAIAGRVCPLRPISGRTTRCIFCWVLLGFTLPSRAGCVQRSQRRLRARSHRSQHRPQKGGWLTECTGWDSVRQRCDRTCEIHLGTNRQELICFSRGDCGGSRFWILTQPLLRVGECKLGSCAFGFGVLVCIRRGGVVGGRSVGIR